MLRLFRFLKPFTIPILAVFVLVFFQSLSELYLPTLMSDIVDIGIVNGDTFYILRVGGLMLLVAAVGTVCTILASYLSSTVAAGFGRDLRSRIFSHAQSFSMHEFDKIGTASMITRTTNDITQVQMVVIMMMRMMVSAPMMFIGGIIMAVSRDTKLSLIFVIALPLLVAIIFTLARKGMPLFTAMQKKLDRLNLILRQNLTGIRVIRAFNRTEHEKKRFNEANKDLADNAIKVNRIMASLMPLMMVMMNLTTIAIIWFGGIRIDSGHMQVGDMMAFLQYSMHIMFSLLTISMMFVMVPRASASAVRINEVLDIVPEITDPAQVKQPAGEQGKPAGREQAKQADGVQTKHAGGEQAKHADGEQGFLEFKDVTFSYPGAEQPALMNITFSASPGKITAIIGGTGAGKSTLVNLILRFYDIDSGSILVDGIDIREMPQNSLRAKIGYVPQNAILFTGTVADNIRFGKEDASDEEVRRAAAIAQADEFISSMEGGYSSQISQGGTNISGGQKQRLSIARALVRRSEIYIFDDSFSALDFKTDARLRAALKKELSYATVLIVAQRVSTVMDADNIIVLDEGRIAGMGSHKDLLKTCKVYREIVASQLSEEEIA